ncbi:uncharacterized protein LOC119913062 [Micropterus salmoides]|uniref:uncharacterized protein LOC119913062 n=1 Tax=Micropterus salmoides TaxID=27706 RepID=UPI0018EACECF|nr:uncharacterized protein LOC119913062 [Micropterus salmoides]
MGCCFSKELNPGQQNERSGLLQPALHNGLNEVTEQVRQHAAAVAQHVCLDEEDTCVADGPAQRKPPEDEDRHQGLDCKVWTEAVSGDITSRSERDLKPASAHEEKGAIINTTSTNIHIDTDAEAGMTHPARPSCGPAPYMEVLTQSPVRQKILENATVRALWFNPLPNGEKQHKPSGCLSAPAMLPSANFQGDVTASEVLSDQPPSPVSVCQGTLRDFLRPEYEEEEGEEVCVVATTLGQGFETRTRSFYSICSIDADDLEHDHVHSQSQTAGATHSPHTAEVETAALPCIVESPVSSQSHAEAPTACYQLYVTESKMTSEPASAQSRAAEQSEKLFSAAQTTSPHPVASPQLVKPLCDPLPPATNHIKDHPQASTQDSPQPEDFYCQTAAKYTDESRDDIQLTSHKDERACVEAGTVKGSEECVCVESVCLVEESLYLGVHRAAEGGFSATKVPVVKSQEEELEQSVDSDFNPLGNHLHQVALPLSGGQTEKDKTSLQGEAFPVSICRSYSEEGDVCYNDTADTTLTNVSSVSTVPVVSSLPTDLTAFSLKTTSCQSDSITSDILDVNSNDPTFNLSSTKHPSQDAEHVHTESEHRDARSNEKADDALDDEPVQEVLMSGDDRQAVKKPKPEMCQNSKHIEGGDVTVVLPETGQNTPLS